MQEIRQASRHSDYFSRSRGEKELSADIAPQQKSKSQSKVKVKDVRFHPNKEFLPVKSPRTEQVKEENPYCKVEMEEMTEDPVPKRPRSVKSSAEDTPAVMTYEQLQARNI